MDNLELHQEEATQFDNNLIIINTPIAENANNKHSITNDDLNYGLKYNSEITTEPINSILNLLSNTAKYQQEYSNLYIKDYTYTVGSIVSILFYNTDSNSFKLYYFRANQTTNQLPILNTYNEDDLYFTGSNILFNTDWTVVNMDSNIVDNTLRIKEVQYQDLTITNKSNYRIIQLLDYNNLTNVSINYTLELSRNNQCFISEQSINLLNNSIAKINIKDVFSTKYTNYYTDECVINNYGLLGCYLLHDKTNKFIYLAIYGNNELIDNYININVSYKISTNKLDLIECNIDESIELESMEAIQLIVSNNNSGEIIQKQESLSDDEVYKQGLIKVTNEDITLSWPYKDLVIKGFKNKYLLCNNNNDLIGDYTNKQCSYEKYSEVFTSKNYSDGNFTTLTPISGSLYEGNKFNNNNNTEVGVVGWYSANTASSSLHTTRYINALNLYFRFSRFQDTRSSSSFNMFNNNKIYYYVAL